MQTIRIVNADRNNLKNVSLQLELDQWITFIGKSGSGKSTLANIIFEGSSCVNKEVYVPVEASIFRQKVSIPNGTKGVFSYFGLRKNSENDLLGDALLAHLEKKGHTENRNLISYILEAFEIGFLKCSMQLSELSLSTFNKVRFLKFLLKNTAKLLIVDELASGMCYSEAKTAAMVLKRLVKEGYSLITIEHSIPMILESDYIVEIGPGAGINGGTIVFEGKVNEYIKSKNYKRIISDISNVLPLNKVNRKMLKIEDIEYHNLRIPMFKMPVNCVVNVCGLLGSGKSSLLDIVFRAFDKSSNAWKNREGINGEVSGKDYIRRPHFVDQIPIGSNSMSTPATYTKIMDILRDLFSQLPESKEHGYSVSNFSYNSVGGCTTCGGKGVSETFIDDEIILTPCPVCNGTRYLNDINKIKIGGLSIGAMLQLSCEELITKCPDKEMLKKKLGFICDVGLPYLTLGQSSLSLSGGESQRIKITKELAKKLGDRSLFILDTPSRGLHPGDFSNILLMMRNLVKKNNSILIADNNPFFVRNADWLIFLDNNHIIFQGYSSELPPELASKLGLEDFYEYKACPD